MLNARRKILHTCLHACSRTGPPCSAIILSIGEMSGFNHLRSTVAQMLPIWGGEFRLCGADCIAGNHVQSSITATVAYEAYWQMHVR